jgi:hypothetical protein
MLQEVSDEKLAELARDPSNRVLCSVPSAPLSKPVPLDTVERNVRRCWKRYCELKGKKPELTPVEFNAIKATLDDEFKQFEFTHPTFYSQIVKPDATQEHIDTMLYIINVRREDPSEAGHAKVKERLKSQFIGDAKQGKK